jgi:hypothetical protein
MSPLDDIFSSVSFSGIDGLPKDSEGLPSVTDDEDSFSTVKAAAMNDDPYEGTPHDVVLQNEIIAKTSGIALQIGDQVEVECMGIQWGEGTITERSTTDYGGSKLYPVFHVVSDDGQDIWMSAISLHKVA